MIAVYIPFVVGLLRTLQKRLSQDARAPHLGLGVQMWSDA